MSDDATMKDALQSVESTEAGRDDDAPQATDHAQGLADLPAVAGGQDDTDPEQGEGVQGSW